MGTLVRQIDAYYRANRLEPFTSMSSAASQVHQLGLPDCFLVMLACDGLSAEVRQLS